MYKSSTYGSRDPLRRFSHKSRLEVASSLFEIPENGRVLDFGGGDGALLELIMKRSKHPFDAVLFEPYMDVTSKSDFVHAKDWNLVQELSGGRLFDVVFCQEVREHFAPHRQDEALQRIASVMAPGGALILSVPVELGPVALVKNIGRWKYRRGGKDIYNYRNLLSSLFAIPIPNARSGDDYLTHMGFYYSDFQKILARHFMIEKTVGSPFQALPLALNSQVFYRASLLG